MEKSRGDSYSLIFIFMLFISLVFAVSTVYLFLEVNTLKLQVTTQNRQYPPTPTKSLQPPNQNVSWITYTNETFGYSIDHPNDWKISEVDDSGPGNEAYAYSTFTPPDEKGLINISAEKPEISWEYYRGELLNNGWIEYDFNGLPALLYNEAGLGADRYIIFELPDSGRTINITVSDDFGNKKSVMDEILSTFLLSNENQDTSWTTYYNPDANYSYSYPADWGSTEPCIKSQDPDCAAEVPTYSTVSDPDSAYPQGSLTLEYHGASYCPMETENVQKYNWQNLSRENITVFDTDGILFKGRENIGDATKQNYWNDRRVILISRGNYCYIINTASNRNPRQEEIFDQIISSIEFTEILDSPPDNPEF